MLLEYSVSGQMIIKVMARYEQIYELKISCSYFPKKLIHIVKASANAVKNEC